MIKNKIKNEKGVSLISLIIIVVILLILSNIMIYNLQDSLKMGKLESMQSDIQNLEDKISSYYIENGSIPASLEYTNVEHIREAGLISDAVDTGKFLVIDLAAIDNLTLNYGQDFEKVKSLTSLTDEEAKQYTDLYIINEASHNIFYVHGIAINDEVYYTDYTAEYVDQEEVDLRYIEGIKIPDGFSYVDGTKDTGIIIQDESGNQYRWIQQDEEIENIPDGIEIEDSEKEDFIRSVNIYKGYYKSENSNEVIYIGLENWSPIYDETGIYKDKNEDTAYIPAGFQVSQTPGEDTIQDGLVIQDEYGNQFVWVPVEDPSKFVRANWNSWSGTGEPPAVSSNRIEDASNDPTGKYDEMVSSVETNHGFYIGRFEAGNEGGTYNSETQTWEGDNTLVVKKDKNVWNYIPWGTDETEPGSTYIPSGLSVTKVGTEGAVYRATNFVKDTYTDKGKEVGVKSTLVYGVQWDAVLRWISEDEELKGYITNSEGKGNYDSDTVALTGSNPNYQIKNIYDMAGNVMERTMESYETTHRYNRGGSFDSSYTNKTCLSHSNLNLPGLEDSVGFRVALYL